MSIFKESTAYRPFVYPFAVTAEKEQAIDTYWHEGQIDLQDDLRQYHGKDGLATPSFSHEHNKRILDTLLLFFTQLDMSVAEGYVELIPYAKNNEIKCLLIQEAAKEVRHQRAYALAGETFGFTDSDWSAFLQYKEMTDKIGVIEGVVEESADTPLGFAKRLSKVLLGEGIGLYAAFADLINFKRYGLLMGFNDVNVWSLLDEQLHVKNNINVVQRIMEEDLTTEENDNLRQYVESLVKQYVETEHALIDFIGDIEGCSVDKQKEYISYLGRYRLYQIGYLGSFEVGKNPLPWMDDMLSATKHGAFFEKRITDYTHKKLEGEVDYGKYRVLLNK